MAINRLYSKQLKLEDMFISGSRNQLTKKQEKELQKLADEVKIEAKKVKSDYENNPSEMNGSVFHIHENSPILDTLGGSDEPLYSGSRWTHIIKTQL